MQEEMIIPYKELARKTLNNLIEEFVTRDGTDNGYDQDVNIKIERVFSLLKKGDIVIVYNANLESVNIVPYDSVRHLDRT